MRIVHPAEPGRMSLGSSYNDPFLLSLNPVCRGIIISALVAISTAAKTHSPKRRAGVENIVEMLKMDVGTVQSLIGSLGFPIACVIAMFYMWNKEREDHKSEMQEVTKAIENNTLALTTLVSKLSE